MRLGCPVAVLLFAIRLCGSVVYVSNCSIGPVGGPFRTQHDGGYCSLGYSPDNFNSFVITGIGDDRRYNPQYDQLGVGTLVYTEGVPSSPIAYSIDLSAYETLQTSGPRRIGVISYSIGNSNFSPGSSQAGISDGVHTYGHGSCSSCNTVRAAPFELGSVFSVLTSVTELGLISPYRSSSGATVDFSLFEADGVTPVDIVNSPDGTQGIAINFNAPEPSTLGMSLLAVLTGIAYTVLTKKEAPKSAGHKRAKRSNVPASARLSVEPIISS